MKVALVTAAPWPDLTQSNRTNFGCRSVQKPGTVIDCAQSESNFRAMSEEPNSRDDAIIGRAFRRSLVVLLLVGAAVAGVSFVLERKPPPARAPITDPASPDSPRLPVAGFADITRAAGINFAHNNGAYGDKLLPETMGGGVAFFDFDADGAPDLLLVNSTYW